MHVGVIGAGASGLATARYLIKNGLTCEVFERNDNIGGTWYYIEETNVDKYGFPIYAPMYSGLITNLPKEVMGYPDYKYKEPKDRCYISHEEVLSFLKKYADDHNLRQYIKFLSPVTEVHHLPNNRWSLKILDLPTKKETVKEFDAVVICSGRCNEGLYPNIPGINTFKGHQIHSHEYRKPDAYTGKKVLVIGAGPSGLDISFILSDIAESVILSHRSDKLATQPMPANVTVKPETTHITETGAIFQDGSSIKVDCIIYCTGYKFKFPFLHEDCKITIEDDVYMKPLYNMIINIEYPTMAFIGIPHTACSIPMYDLQIRYYMEYLKGTMNLPSKEKMYEETAADLQKRKSMGFTKRQYHLMNIDFVWDYYKGLADSAKIENIWPSITKLRLAGAKQIVTNYLHFRKDKYKIVDKDNFVKIS